jgi:hypothetical protein
MERYYWKGRTPKFGIKHEIYFPAGFTEQQCQEMYEKQVTSIDAMYQKKCDEVRWKKDEKYAKSKLPKYKQKAIDELKKEIQQRHTNNNSRFMGGYTGPAIADHKAEVDRIKIYEEQRMAQIEKEFDGSRECLERILPIARKDDRDYEEAVQRNQRMNGGGSLHPRVGGPAGYHAASHGGGFNHPGVYAGGVW